MHVLTAEGWEGGYLDEPLLPASIRIEVHKYLRLAPVDGLYFTRTADPRMLRNYVREYGVRDVARKVVSRRAEAMRNDRWLAVGTGRSLTDAPDLPAGSAVLFVSTTGPRCAERVVVPSGLVQQADVTLDGPLQHADAPDAIGPDLAQLSGWSQHSGVAPPSVEAALTCARGLLRSPREWRTDLPGRSGHPSTSRPGTAAPDGRARAVLHGYGGYAKTVVIPTISRHLQLVRVVEFDPYQLGTGSTDWAVCTEPEEFEEDNADAVILAGYHHTHAIEALQALRRQQVAVIEKPPATRLDELELLRAEMGRGGQVSISYQRRYSGLLQNVRSALPVGEPITYRAVVFEEPLPPRHWYRWPSSRTRLLSNGVHWIDEFLGLTGYQTPVRTEHFASSRGEETSTVLELEDGSFMTLALSSRGANPHGLSDFVEIRAGDVTARIVDSARLQLQRGPRRSARRARRLDSYRLMYKAIAEAAACGEGLDTPDSATAAARTALQLEEEPAARLTTRAPG